jgi:hypothetical protein
VPHVVALAEFDAVAAEDVVGGHDVEIEMRDSQDRRYRGPFIAITPAPPIVNLLVRFEWAWSGVSSFARVGEGIKDRGRCRAAMRKSVI